MSRRVLASLFAVFIAVGCKQTPTIEMIPVGVGPNHRVIAKLETRIYWPSGDGPFPVAILSHGSSGGTPLTSLHWEREGAYLAKKGYVVLAPMRKGRGKSTGQSLESEEKNCDPESWRPGLASSMQDIDATIEFSKNLKSVAPHQVVLMGVSRGGFLSVAYAAQGKYRTEVLQVVNFVGGWVAQAEDQCPTDFNLLSFGKFGSLTKTPVLWLYGANDLFYGDSAVANYIEAFKASGGLATFHLVGGIPKNGHWLPNYPDRWEPYVDQFLP